MLYRAFGLASILPHCSADFLPQDRMLRTDKMSEPPTKIAFGSCFKQYKDGAKQTKILERITEEKPEMFFWTGDAAYQEKKGYNNFKLALNQTKYNPAYQKLIANIPVDGIWDDHDLGPNDADRNVARIQDRRKDFLEFLGVPATDPRLHPDMKALYFTKEFGPQGKKVKFFFLDTRTERKTYYKYDRSKCFEAMLCVMYENELRAKKYRNDRLVYENAESEMLGEEQHEWFEKELKNSDADVHIVVSGIQILATDMKMENWMHWHADRRRLFRTLKEVNPKGLIFLSGDVHHAEYFKLGGTYMEMTSSGINRGNLSENPEWYLKPIAEQFCGVKGQNYCLNNYGMLEFDWKTREVKVSARGEDGKEKLSWIRHMDDRVAVLLDLYQPTYVKPSPSLSNAFMNMSLHRHHSMYRPRRHNRHVPKVPSNPQSSPKVIEARLKAHKASLKLAVQAAKRRRHAERNARLKLTAHNALLARNAR